MLSVFGKQVHPIKHKYDEEPQEIIFKKLQTTITSKILYSLSQKPQG